MTIFIATLGLLAALIGLLLPPLQALLPRLSLFFYYRQQLVRRLLLLTSLILTGAALLLGRSGFTWAALALVLVFCLMEEFLLVPRKVIPPLDDPAPREAGSGEIAPGELVLGLVVEGQARAYPLSVLIPHHIVNEVVAGRPVTAAYCPACRSGYIFDPVVDGQRLTFEPVSVHRRNMVMRDLQSGTVWQHETGEARLGKYQGRRLGLLESEMCNWKAWQEDHPSTSVCLPPKGYRHPSPLGFIFEKLLDHGPEHLVGPGLHGLDRRLEQHDFIIGLEAEGTAKAYPLERLKQERIIFDQLGTLPVALTYDPATERVRAYKRLVGGSEGAFPPEGISEAMLEPIPVARQWWLAWSEYHPGSEIYGGIGEKGASDALSRPHPTTK